MATGPERVVNWLGTHPGTWTSLELAEALGVTSRSIRNYLADLGSRAVPIVERTPKGYRILAVDPGGSMQDIPATGADGVVDVPTAQARSYAIVLRSLTHHGPVSVYDLALELGVSESTIDGDLRALTRMTAGSGARVIRSGDGVLIEGSEADRRALLRRSLTEAADAGSLLDADRLQSAFASYDIGEIRGEVAHVLAEHGLHTSDYSLNPLILDLLIVLDRITDDHVLDAPHPVPVADIDPRLVAATRDLTGYLERAYGTRFTGAESESLGILLASKTTLLRGKTDGDLVLAHVDPLVPMLVRSILRTIDETYLVDLMTDAFVTSLALHTHNLLLRLRIGRPQSNPLAASIPTSHPLVHELAVFFARELEFETGVSVPLDEVGFLAFHLGSALDRGRLGSEEVTVSVVVPGYHDLAHAIAGRVQERVHPRARVVQVIETPEPQAAQLTSDLVVTPIPVTGVHPSRLIQISPLLNDGDLDLIETQVRIQQRRNTWLRLTSRLRELFDPDTFFVSPEVSGRDQVLTLLCDALRGLGTIPDDFYEHVLEREARSATAFNDVVAIPHTLDMSATRTSIAVATFDEPLDWAGTPVRLVLLVAFSAADRSLFRDTFDQLVIALTEPRNVYRLVARGRGIEEFLAELTTLIQAE